MVSTVVDLRSDVFITPTDEMWAAMRAADVGWAYLGQDRSVNRLEELAAEIVGKEAAVFVPTCSMANLAALMTLAPRGSGVIFEATSHVATTEASGLAYVVGVVPRLLGGRAGALDAEAVATAFGSRPGSAAIRTTLVCLENTHNNAGGTVITPSQTDTVARVAHHHGAAAHLDGARLFNAAVALSEPVRRLAAGVDTVSFSLNKGLGAPFGAMLAGSRSVIEDARVNLHRLGAASIHQAGILAAGAIVALSTGIERLGADHRRARDLARIMRTVPGLRVDLESVQTNIVAADISGSGMDAAHFVASLAEHGVLAFPRPPSGVRFVTHRLIGEREIERAATAVAAVVS